MGSGCNKKEMKYLSLESGGSPRHLGLTLSYATLVDFKRAKRGSLFNKENNSLIACLIKLYKIFTSTLNNMIVWRIEAVGKEMFDWRGSKKYYAVCPENLLMNIQEAGNWSGSKGLLIVKIGLKKMIKNTKIIQICQIRNLLPPFLKFFKIANFFYVIMRKWKHDNIK